MNIYTLTTYLSLILLASGCMESQKPCTPVDTDLNPTKEVDLSESLKNSLVFLEITANSYEQFQPWKQADLIRREGYATAVGPYEVITTAWNVTDAAFIKARKHGQNEYINAEIRVIDYESNLCLLTLDKKTVKEPLEAVEFFDLFDAGSDLSAYSITGGGEIVTARGFLDRADVKQSTVSHGKFINYIASNTPNSPARAKLFTMNDKAIGIACWTGKDNGETGIIPSETINKFIKDANSDTYKGFAAVGFSSSSLLNPDTRKFLSMPEDMSNGIYVSDVYKLGTGCDVLKQGDVLLEIDGFSLDANGRYEDPVYKLTAYHHLITKHLSGDKISFNVWRNNDLHSLTAKAQNFSVDDMLVPYHEFSQRPEYIVIGGFLLQKLTRNYLSMWGDDWSGKVPPHLYHYYRDMMFDPDRDRRQIVLLNYVLPHTINLGYHSIGRLVVKTINDKPITGIADIPDALSSASDSPFHIIEFEQDTPTVVIPKDQLDLADSQIAERYGIPELSYLR